MTRERIETHLLHDVRWVDRGNALQVVLHLRPPTFHENVTKRTIRTCRREGGEGPRGWDRDRTLRVLGPWLLTCPFDLEGQAKGSRPREWFVVEVCEGLRHAGSPIT